MTSELDEFNIKFAFMNENIYFIDSHAHLDAEQFDKDRDDLICSLEDNRIEKVVTIGDNLENSRKAVKIAEKFPAVFSTIGVHPHYAKDFSDEIFFEFDELIKHPKVVAVGEIGLDYHYEFSKKEIQKKVFKRFIEYAVKSDKPVVIHNRDSDDDLLSILKESGINQFSGIIHCFQSDMDMVKKLLDYGFYISFSGLITFKNAENLRKIVAYVPLNRLLIETDSPYLAPEPKRGKRNEPAFVKYVAQKIAEIKNITLAEVAEQTIKNTRTVYKI